MSVLNNFSQEVDDYIILSFQSFDPVKIISGFIKKNSSSRLTLSFKVYKTFRSINFPLYKTLMMKSFDIRSFVLIYIPIYKFMSKIS